MSISRVALTSILVFVSILFDHFRDSMKKKVLLISLIIVVTVGLALFFYVKNILDNAGGRMILLADNIEADSDGKKIELAKFRFYKKESNIISVDFDPPKHLDEREMANLFQLEVEDFEGGRCSLRPVNPNPILNRGIYFRGDGACFTDPNKYKSLWIKSSDKIIVRINWWGANDEDMKR